MYSLALVRVWSAKMPAQSLAIFFSLRLCSPRLFFDQTFGRFGDHTLMPVSEIVVLAFLSISLPRCTATTPEQAMLTQVPRSTHRITRGPP
ncbi:hypothetical protein VTK73DRAFT_3244 [Phialemonium thermophilum]|uniref:Secreted protein n=1 Tax=Phialemonium thermophilum TaxID=223376 RepID=A0ABR3Y7H4_9PEZI